MRNLRSRWVHRRSEIDDDWNTGEMEGQVFFNIIDEGTEHRALGWTDGGRRTYEAGAVPDEAELITTTTTWTLRIWGHVTVNLKLLLTEQYTSL
jgi:hypothetical protein